MEFEPISSHQGFQPHAQR